MKKMLLSLVGGVALASWSLTAQDAKTVLETAAKTMGPDVKSIQYSGAGANFAVGQSPRPDVAWPRFNVKSFTAAIDYGSVSMRQEMVRTQGENPPRGGGGQPLAGEQRQIQVVSGKHAWNVAGDSATPAPATLDERLLQIWSTPHGFLKAAMASGATARPDTQGGRKLTRISFTAHGKYKMSGLVNDQNLVEKVETSLSNPVLGDMPIEITFSDYKDFGGVKFPGRIVQNHGGFPALDLTISTVQPNAAVDIQVPANVQQAVVAALKVDPQKIADGVWYLAGGSHHSVAVELKDHVVVIEAPQSEERSTAVIAEVKKSVPNKPIRYLVNTHHHFDHSGGLRTYVAEGTTIVTHQLNRPFYERTFAAPRTLTPDRLSQSKKTASFETVADKKVITNGTRTLEIHHVQGNTHNDALLMVYLPKERILIEADAYTPAAPNTPAPATPNPFTMNLYENVRRLKLDVGPIAPLHGRIVTWADLLSAIGKSGSS